MAATPIKKCVFPYFIQQAIANTKLDYFTDWGRHRVRSLFCWKKVILDFSSRRLGWVCTFWWDFNIISFFNAICGLLTKRANINTHQHGHFLGDIPLNAHYRNTVRKERTLDPGTSAYIHGHIAAEWTHWWLDHGRLNVIFTLQVFVIVDVRLESTQLWKKCFKNILYSDRRVSNLPPVIPGDSWVLKEYISLPCESDT